MRRILAVLPLAALIAAVGCHHWPFNNNGGGGGGNDGPPPPLFGRNAEPKAADLVGYLNDNARRVKGGVYCKNVVIEAKQGGQPVGMDAQMSCEKPRNFRMKAVVGGHNVADFGSNDADFWYWVSQADPPYVFHGNYDAMKTARTQLPIPFQPDLVIAALGIGEYDPNGHYEVRNYKDTIELIEPTTSIQGKPVFKVTVFNRGAVTASKPQVLAYLLKDAKGTDIAIARVTSAQVHRESGAVLPKRLELVLIPEKPNEKIEMKMIFDNLQVVTFDAEQRATQFALRDALENRQGFDLARGALDGGPGMGTSIQRTNGHGIK